MIIQILTVVATASEGEDSFFSVNIADLDSNKSLHLSRAIRVETRSKLSSEISGRATRAKLIASKLKMFMAEPKLKLRVSRRAATIEEKIAMQFIAN